MKQSQLFAKTRKDAPKDEVSKNAQLLLRAGFIHKEMAGAYAYLPLGLRALNKVIGIIREEMDAIGGQELSMTALQDKAVWEKTNRWDDKVVDVWFKTKLKNDAEVGLGFTHEEPLTNMMKQFVGSYRNLPFSVYQFQTKFRNETRAKSGIMRCREFIMKDLYSFSRSAEEHEAFYEKAKQAYVTIFKRLGLGDATYLTYASGGSFSKYSHEFQTLTDAGEDMIHICDACHVAVNEEILADLENKCPECGKAGLRAEKAVEVGNIFSLGTKFSDAFDLTFADESGEVKKVVMGSYGIGPGRALGTVAELLSDDKGLVWPKAIAPFRVHLVELISENPAVHAEAERLYAALRAVGIDVLHDDRDARAGEKFADSDLIGIPTRVVVSEKTLESKSYETKDRATGESKQLDEAALMAELG